MIEVPPVGEAVRVKSALRVDGDVRKEPWKSIRPMPLVDNGGHQSRHETWAKAAWSDTHLYLAFWGADEDAWSTFFGHDDPIYRNEVFEFFFSPDGDLDRYYEMEWNPNDAVFDAKVARHGEERSLDLSWHAEGMKSVARVDKGAGGKTTAWSVEAGIPFSCIDRLEHAPYPEERWRVNFYRIDMPGRRQPQELYAWSPTLIANFHRPEFFGELVFAR